VQPPGFKSSGAEFNSAINNDHCLGGAADEKTTCLSLYAASRQKGRKVDRADNGALAFSKCVFMPWIRISYKKSTSFRVLAYANFDMSDCQSPVDLERMQFEIVFSLTSNVVQKFKRMLLIKTTYFTFLV